MNSQQEGFPGSAEAQPPAKSRLPPIFLVGTGRCGSSITHSLLAMHPQLAWIPSWLNVAPSIPQLAAVNRFWNLPGTDRLRHRRYFPNPTEPNVLFRHWTPGYMSEVVDVESVEVARARLVPVIEKITRWHGKRRFLCKIVGRPVKVEFLHRLFPDGLFVHITRGFYPTVSSLVRVDFFDQTGSLDPWPWGPISERQMELYRDRQQPVELVAAIQSDHNLAELERQLDRVPAAQRIDFAYAELVSDPLGALGRLGVFANLPMDVEFERRLERRVVRRGADEKWKTYFNDDQLRNLEDFRSIATSRGFSGGTDP